MDVLQSFYRNSSQEETDSPIVRNCSDDEILCGVRSFRFRKRLYLLPVEVLKLEYYRLGLSANNVSNDFVVGLLAIDSETGMATGL